jgi:hypothetical protein
MGTASAFDAVEFFMRNKVVFCLIVAAAVVLFAAVATVAAGRRCNRDSAGYDVLAERMFEGTIAGKGYTLEGLVYIPLKTADADVEVQIGPKNFIASRNFKLKRGDRVTVVGVPVVVQERIVVLAREISTLNGALILRDDRGVPLWDTNRPIHMDPERRTGLFETCEMF